LAAVLLGVGVFFIGQGVGLPLGPPLEKTSLRSAFDPVRHVRFLFDAV
jgi:hypothetical protein